MGGHGSGRKADPIKALTGQYNTPIGSSGSEGIYLPDFAGVPESIKEKDIVVNSITTNEIITNSPVEVKGEFAEGGSLSQPILIGLDDGANVINAQANSGGDLKITLDSEEVQVKQPVFANLNAIVKISDGTDEALVNQNASDSIPTSVNGLVGTNLIYCYNGTTWDRIRGSITDGLLVNLGSNNDVTISGDVAHDSSDSGNPIKTGGKAIDITPDSEGSQMPTAVGANDRVNQLYDLNGRTIEKPAAEYQLLTEIDQNYDDSPTTATSSAYACDGYRWCTLFFALDSTLSPTDITIEVLVSPDGTNFHTLTNDALGLLIYDDVSCATEIHEAYTFPIACKEIKVKVTATGTNATNYFSLDDTALYFRN